MTTAIDQSALFECMDIALTKTKDITRYVRDQWALKDSSFGILDVLTHYNKGNKQAKDFAAKSGNNNL